MKVTYEIELGDHTPGRPPAARMADMLEMAAVRLRREATGGRPATNLGNTILTPLGESITLAQIEP